MFNLIEITSNNTLQVRNLVVYGDEALSVKKFHRYTVDSRSDLSGEPELVQQVAELFPFIEDVTHADGIHEDVSLIRVMNESQASFRYDITVHVVENGETVASERKPPQVVHALDDVSGLPEKVQKVANLLFA